MRFSVVIPCHNASKWIAEALESVKRQTLEPWEVIVIDDASADDSAEVIGRAMPDAELIRVDAGNGAASRNVGIERASGDWIAFLDSDDIWYPNRLSRAAMILAKAHDMGYLSVFDKMTMADSTPVRSSSPWPGISEVRTGLDTDAYMEIFSRRTWFPGMSAFIGRTDLLKELGGLDQTQKRRHDIELWFRMLPRGTWTFDPVATTAYRVDTEGSISRNIPDRERYMLEAVVKHKDLLPSRWMKPLLELHARRAMAGAVTDGSGKDIKQTTVAAWPYLSSKDRWIFRFALLFPGLFRSINQRRRSSLASHHRPEIRS